MSIGVLAKKEQVKLATSLTAKTHLKYDSVMTLLNVLQELAGGGKLDRVRFRDVLHTQFEMLDDILMDRVFKAFDKDNDSYISAQEWVYGVCLFLNSTLEEKIKYCFTCYDLNGDGYISREEMIHLMKHAIVKQSTDEDADEGVKDLVDIALKKMDKDHDGRLSYADYRQAVKEEPLLLEAFGMCLPSEQRRKAFMMKYCSTEPEAEKELQFQHMMALRAIERQNEKMKEHGLGWR